MNYVEIFARLARIENMRAFATASGIPRQTLLNVRAGKSATTKTLDRIASELLAHKPQLRKKT